MHYDFYQFDDGSFAILDEITCQVVKKVNTEASAKLLVSKLEILTDSMYSQMTHNEYQQFLTIEEDL